MLLDFDSVDVSLVVESRRSHVSGLLSQHAERMSMHYARVVSVTGSDWHSHRTRKLERSRST